MSEKRLIGRGFAARFLGAPAPDGFAHRDDAAPLSRRIRTA
ncbi:hypothetical protein [Nonomuraea sp. NPDC049709]